MLDWGDEQAAAILRACRRAIRPTGRLLVIEPVLGPPNEGALQKFADLVMLVVPGGQVRTSEELAALFARADFRLTRVTPTASEVTIVEGIPE